MKRNRLFLSMLLVTAVGCQSAKQDEAAGGSDTSQTAASVHAAHKQQRLAEVEQNVERLLAQLTLDEKSL